MTAIQYATSDGVRHDWSSIEANIAGQIFIGITSITYSRERTRAMLRGTHPDPIGKTRGTNEYKCEIEMFLAEFMQLQALLIKAAAAAGLPSGDSPGSGYGDVFFKITVSHADDGFDPITDIIEGCTLDTTDASNSQSADPLKRKFSVSPLKIRYGQEDDLATVLQGPPGNG
jgi:hypothetical protein